MSVLGDSYWATTHALIRLLSTVNGCVGDTDEWRVTTLFDAVLKRSQLHLPARRSGKMSHYGKVKQPPL